MMAIIKEERLTWDKGGKNREFVAVRSDILSSHDEDKHLKRVDDAKKSAIVKSRDYDEFKDLVSTCHLKPIQKNEFNAPAKLISRNSLFNGRTANEGTGVVIKAIERCKEECAVSSQDFCAKFLRTSDKWSYLCLHSDSQLCDLFSKAMDETLFAECVACVDENTERGREILSTFSKFNWFGKALGFLSSAEKAKATLQSN